MDSKLKAVAITTAVILITTVFALVIGVNYIQKDWSGGDEKKADTASSDVNLLSGNGTKTPKEGSLAERYDLNPDRDPYAYLADEEFFDPEVERVDPVMTLSLLMSSVDKDLRVNVVDGNGERVADQEFWIDVTDASGEEHRYKDADRDGSILVAPAEPGNYEVSLEEVEGYLVSEEKVPVTVKKQLEYTLIDDIGFLMKTEDEIDPLVEDTGINEAELAADGTENNVRLTEEDAMFGIDVSKYQKEIDWKKVKESGVDFAVIRCGYRGSSTGALVEDPYFEKNIKGAQEAGIRVGIYFFTQAVNEVEAVEEASMALTLARSHKMALPIFIDTEGAGGHGRADGISMETRTAVCAAFCRTVDNAGFNAGVYASKNWFEKNLVTKELEDYNIWLAQYSKKATYEGRYDLWQYTSAGTVDGILTRVDLNLCYKKFD